MMRFGLIDIDLNSETLYYNGAAIPPEVCSDILLGYERMCTANYIRDEHPDVSEAAAWEYAGAVRDVMDDHPTLDEDTAILIVLGKIEPDYDDWDDDGGLDFEE